MSNLLLAAFLISIPFAFKAFEVFKDQKQKLKEMDEKYEQSKRNLNNNAHF